MVEVGYRAEAVDMERTESVLESVRTSLHRQVEINNLFVTESPVVEHIDPGSVIVSPHAVGPEWHGKAVGEIVTYIVAPSEGNLHGPQEYADLLKGVSEDWRLRYDKVQLVIKPEYKTQIEQGDEITPEMVDTRAGFYAGRREGYDLLPDGSLRKTEIIPAPNTKLAKEMEVFAKKRLEDKSLFDKKLTHLLASTIQEEYLN